MKKYLSYKKAIEIDLYTGKHQYFEIDYHLIGFFAMNSVDSELSINFNRYFLL
jgi:hypothetical protein